jgi:hypothetical protein|nr:MAG TPA: hypothetical protein [Caudoviricetes sp.]
MALPVVMHAVWQLYGITKSKLLQFPFQGLRQLALCFCCYTGAGSFEKTYKLPQKFCATNRSLVC